MFNRFINELCNTVWGLPMLVFMVGVGLLLTVKTKFLQIRRFKSAMLSPFSKNNNAFACLCTALGGTMGTGNIIGVTLAVSAFGGGVIFWIVVSSFFSMIIKYCEIYLAVLLREKKNEKFYGGAMYSIKNGLDKSFMPLSYIFCICFLFASFGTGNLVQSKSICECVSEILPFNRFYVNLVVGFVCALLCFLILFGKANKTFAFAEKCVPLMTVSYIAICLTVIISNSVYLKYIIKDIFVSAFKPSSAIYGVSTFTVIKKGFSRGMFSNEAGLGTAPMSYSESTLKSPHDTALLGIFEVFCDTVIVCSLTGITALTVKEGITASSGIGAVKQVFYPYFKIFTLPIISSIIILFAFTSIISWGFYGKKAAFFMFGNTGEKLYVLTFCIVLIFGSMLDTSAVWGICEALNGIMAIPNLTSLILLREKLLYKKENTCYNNIPE